VGLSDPLRKSAAGTGLLALQHPTAATDPDLEHYRAASLPPPAPATMVAAAGVLAEPASGRWHARWSAAGDAAAVVLDGVDVGVLAVGEPRGMSRHLLEAGPWGHLGMRSSSQALV
jgi:hypothetical protein